MRRLSLFVILSLLVGVGLWGCGSSRSNFVATPANVANGASSSGSLQLNLSFAELNAGQLVTVANPTGVQDVVFRLARQDQTDLLRAKSVPLVSLNAREIRGQGATRQAGFDNIPFDTPLLLRVEALDSNGARLYDFEHRVIVRQGDQSLNITLTPVEAVRSAAFYVMPYVLLTPEAAAEMAATLAGQTDPGVNLEQTTLAYTPSPCSGWSLEVGSQTFFLESDGRLRVPLSQLGAGTAILHHPNDDKLFASVDLAELGKGQITDKGLVLVMRFDGPCGMDSRTADSEFCGQPIGLPAALRTLEIIAQTVFEVLPASQNTVNDCNEVVPKPTQVEKRARGVYPQPKIVFSDGSVRLFSTQPQCEQTNGGILGPVDPGDVVNATSAGAESDYLFSTCHRYVAFGCCPNENAVADAANVPVAVLSPLLKAGFALSNYFFGTRERGILSPTFIPRDTKTCPDNHGGRQCQELLIGNVSLDFTASGKGGIQFPMDRELVVQVQPGEVVPFVVHNNGCFLDTVVTATRQEINGVLRRTYKEFALSPEVLVANPTTPKLQVSTDPLLGGTPTSGKLMNPTPPTLAQNFTPAAPDSTGLGGFPKNLRHAEIDASIKVTPKGTNFNRYRYFPDVAVTYTVPADAKPGQQDRFLFTVDDCTVPVTFVVVAAPTEPPPTPTPTATETTPPPLTNVRVDLTRVDQTHMVGVTGCPQQLAEIPIGNATSEPVTVTIEAASPLFVDSTSFTLPANTGAALPAIFFDCSTTTSFSATVTIRATSSAGTQVITIPVNLNIQ